MLTVGETVNQAYSWFHFWAESVRHGSVPLWDPYTFGGRSYIGEMQTAAFYPLHLIFALFPANRSGLPAPQLYHLYFVFTHVLAAYFMFALIREMGLNRFPALLAGLCYSLGGFVGAAPWPHLLDSAVWLPLQFLLMLRALQAHATRRSLTYAALAGLTLGLSILAGGLHIVMMQVIVLVSAAAYYAVHRRTGWWRPMGVAAVLVVTGLAAGAVQLLPSAEYSARAIRFISGTSLPATQKIPIAYLVDSILPRSAGGLFVLLEFPGQDGTGRGAEPVSRRLPSAAGHHRILEVPRASVGAVFRGTRGRRISVFAGRVVAAVWIDLRAGAVAMDGARGQPLPLPGPLWIGDSGGLRRANAVLRQRNQRPWAPLESRFAVAGDWPRPRFSRFHMYSASRS